MKLAIGILLVGIVTLSSATPYEVATKQEKVAKLESLLGRALRRTVREQSDNKEDNLADLLASMEQDDGSDDEGAEAESWFRKIKNVAKKVWKHGGKQITKNVGKKVLNKYGKGELGDVLIPATLQDVSQATIEEVLALLQDGDDNKNTEDGTDTSDNSEATIEELLAQLQDGDDSKDGDDSEDGNDNKDDDDDTKDGGKVKKLPMGGRIRNFMKRIGKRFRHLLKPEPAPPPPKPALLGSRLLKLLLSAKELLD